MCARSTLALSFVLALFADIWGMPLLPALSANTGVGRQDSAQSEKPLQPQSRLLLVRDVSGEFAKVVQPLPGGKHGFKLPAGMPINTQSLRDALRLYGTAANPGDKIQITSMEFRDHEIVFLINGGGKKQFHLRDHLEVGIGGDPAPLSAPTSANGKSPGAVLILDYGRPIPDMTPADLKRDLSIMLDFSKEHSASVNWTDTLSPEIQEAIKSHQAIEGMDSEMVIAAMGRPDKKVRERDLENHETEDWIYGTPPAKTTFVTFLGDKVIRVKEFN